jgi:hypothetical protein
VKNITKAEKTQYTTADGLIIYDLQPGTADLTSAVAGPDLPGDMLIDADRLPDGFRRLSAQEFREVVCLDNLTNAAIDAMEDFIANRRDFTPLHPAICFELPMVRPERFYYGSGYNGDPIFCDLTEIGFGSFAPETADDIEEMAAAFAKELLAAKEVTP